MNKVDKVLENGTVVFTKDIVGRVIGNTKLFCNIVDGKYENLRYYIKTVNKNTVYINHDEIIEAHGTL